jgi:hypothetical protein
MLLSVFISAASAESYLYVEERMTLLYGKIEAGAARGALTRDEQGRLKTRFFVLKARATGIKSWGLPKGSICSLRGNSRPSKRTPKDCSGV